MTQAGDILRSAMAPAFPMFAGPVTYVRNDVTITDQLQVAVRDFRGQELFGSAAVGDRLATVQAPDYVAMAIGEPQRYDRIIMTDGTFSVIDWRRAPPVGDAVWFKLAIRGGTK